MRIYSAQAILHVGEAGLEYVDEYENVRMVSFETCGRRAMEQLGEPACVGRRTIMISVTGQVQRRLEFFTTPTTVFEIDSDMEFRRLRFRVEQLGWTLT